MPTCQITGFYSLRPQSRSCFSCCADLSEMIIIIVVAADLATAAPAIFMRREGGAADEPHSWPQHCSKCCSVQRSTNPRPTQPYSRYQYKQTTGLGWIPWNTQTRKKVQVQPLSVTLLRFQVAVLLDTSSFTFWAIDAGQCSALARTFHSSAQLQPNGLLAEVFLSFYFPCQEFQAK